LAFYISAEMNSLLLVSMGLLVIGAAFDLRRREIPNWIPLAFVAVAVCGTWFGWSPLGWVSLATGFSLSLAIGVVLWWRGAFGGGDVKVLAGLGAIVGPRDLISVLFYVALAGGVLALYALLRGQRDLAYMPAIAIGFLIFLIKGVGS
jgi:prepilin peptidase CpaA